MRNFKKNEVVHLFDDMGIDQFYDGWDTLAIVISNDKNGLKIKALENGQVINFVNGEGNGMSILNNIKIPTNKLLKDYLKSMEVHLEKVGKKISEAQKRESELTKQIEVVNAQLK